MPSAGSLQSCSAIWSARPSCRHVLIPKICARSSPHITALSPKASPSSMDLSPSTCAMAFLVYFGYPQAHEDDAERAVRAALGVVDAVGRLDIKSVKMHARVGIATGLVVVGDLIGAGSAQEQSV